MTPKQSPIFTKTEAFMVWLMQHTAKFPRHERFRLARHIDDAIFAFHTHLIHAVYLPDKRQQLTQADMALHRIRAYMRLAVELGYTTPRQYQHAAGHLVELGKLLGGWQKTLKDDATDAKLSDDASD